MVPLLLILLLPLSLADQVCINITKDYNMTISVPNGIISDNPSGDVECMAGVDRSACTFGCTFTSRAWFNTLPVCFSSRVTHFPTYVQYAIAQNSNCTLHLCKADIILPLIYSLIGKLSDQRQMMQLLYIRDSCKCLFSSDEEVKKAFLTVEKNILHNIMEACHFGTEDIIDYSMKALSLDVLNLNVTGLNSSVTSRIPVEAPQLPLQKELYVSEILLPVNALQLIPDDERILGLVSYMKHDMFEFKQGIISSMVLRIELLGGRRLFNLSVPIRMTFQVATDAVVNNDSLLCHYFDETAWLWKTDGCQTEGNNHSEIVCSCDHATAFAVLLLRPDQLAAVHWKILSYISYIGCGLSAFFTALAILMYVFGRNPKMDYSTSIHASLSGALFLLNSTFLLTEWGATVEPAWVCVLVAALMHYSLLCCFTWMAIEALHLYLLLIKVFDTCYKHYLVKLSLVGWGIPGAIVAVSVAVKDVKQFYGVTQLSMADTNQTNAICWITDDSFFYSVNLVYFSLMFIFNSGILISVALRICKMQRMLSSTSMLGAKTERGARRDKMNVSCKSGLTVLGFTCLIGTTWGLAFLGSGYVNYTILYLFCILNSTQGFFIFLWICLSARKQRKQEMEDRMTSATVSTKSD